MPVEVCSYRLSLRGKPVGTHVLKTEGLGRHTQLEGRASFQGSLGAATITQRSRCHSQRHFSLRFREEIQERSEQRSFDVSFDAQRGLVTAAKGQRDVATAPYLRSYRDPLSLLFEIRSLGASESTHVPMLGKDVHVQLAGEVELETAMGLRRAWAYLLHPGQSVVYVDIEAPHLMLKLSQRLAEGQLEALLVKVGSEASLDAFEAEPVQPPERGAKAAKRRARRRRPRRGRRD